METVTDQGSAWAAVKRWAPASGILVFVLAVVSFFTAPSTPGVSESPASVASWYATHTNGAKLSAILVAVAMVFLVLFSISLADRIRRTGHHALLATGTIVGAGMAALGLAQGLQAQLTLAAGHLNAGGVSALNGIENSIPLQAAVGFAVLGIVAGTAVIVSGVLPKWLGVVWIVLGVASAGPLLFFASLLQAVVVLIGGIVLLTRTEAAEPVD